MSESNSLSSRGSVLDRIANPTVVNPLKATTDAAAAATSVYNVREKQAQQAAGEAYQGAINQETGEFDPNKFRTLLSQSGPAAMAAGAALLNTQQISSDQLNQARAKTAWVNNAAGSLTRLGPNITQADVIGTLHQGVTNGMLSQAEFQRQVAEVGALGNDPAKLNAWANQHQFNNMSVQQQLDRTYGTRQAVPAGGSTEFVTIPPAGPNQPNVSVQNTPSPEQRYQLQPSYVPLDANGQPTTPDKAKTWQPVQVPRPGGSNLPPAGPAPVTTTPGTTAPAPPIPPAPGVVRGNTSGVGGYPGHSEIPSSSQVASADNSVVPQNVGAPAAPSDTVAGDVAAIRAGMANARATPSSGTQTAQYIQLPGGGTGIISGPPAGAKEKLDNDIKVSTEASTSMPALRDNLTATETALKALQLSRGFSGPSTSWQASAQALLEANRLSPGDPTKMSAVDWRQVAQKNLLRLAEQQAGTRTNLGLETGLHANPNLDTLTTNANEHVLALDLGRIRQRIVQAREMPDADVRGSAVDHVKNFTNDTDFRGFAWDMLPKSERDAIEKEVEGNKEATARLDKAIELANKYHLLNIPTAKAKGQKGSSVQPSAANALAYAPSANPLAATASGNPLAA